MIFAFRLHRFFLSSKTILNQYFRNFFFYFSIFLLILGFPIIFSPFNNYILKWAYLTSHTIVWFPWAYLFAISLYIFFPRLNPHYLFFFGLLVGEVVQVFIFLFPPAPFFHQEIGILDFHTQFLPSLLIMIWDIIVFCFAALVFIYQGVKNQSIRIKSFIIAFGLFFIIVGGPLHNFVTSFFLTLSADIATLAGFIIIFVGLIWKPKIKMRGGDITKISYS